MQWVLIASPKSSSSLTSYKAIFLKEISERKKESKFSLENLDVKSDQEIKPLSLVTTASSIVSGPGNLSLALFLIHSRIPSLTPPPSWSSPKRPRSGCPPTASAPAPPGFPPPAAAPPGLFPTPNGCPAPCPSFPACWTTSFPFACKFPI
ncbi:ORF31 [Gould's wattled bat adenovirus 1]|nr:ORF31 [Mastadenovirus sp.]